MINQLLITIEEGVDSEDNCWCQGCKYVTFYDAFLCMHRRAQRKYMKLFTQGIWIHEDDFWRECSCYRRDDR